MTREYGIAIQAFREILADDLREERITPDTETMAAAIMMATERLEALVDAVDDLTQATRVNPEPLKDVNDAIGEAVEKVVKP